MKNKRQQLEIINAFQELGTYRAAARLCGITDKTVKRVVARQQSGELGYRTRPAVVKNTEVVKGLVAKKVKATEGMITAKRLLPLASAEGYRSAIAEVEEASRPYQHFEAETTAEDHSDAAGGRRGSEERPAVDRPWSET